MPQLDDIAEMRDRVAALWLANGGPAGPVMVEPCAVSGNNRVYRAIGADGSQIAAKFYFPSAPGERNRLDAEWRFLTHAARAGVDCVPRPVGHDPRGWLALYEFVEGRKLEAGEITADHIVQAADFIRALNARLPRPEDLPDAAEGGASLADHMAVVDRRLARLTPIPPACEQDRQAAELVAAMTDYWHALKARLVAELGCPADQPVADHDRVISPSDFGFHNALLRDDGRLAFIDFEYAGWDDVAKLVADFFLQPAIPVASAFAEPFMARILEGRPDGENTARRIRLLHPLFGVKWLCILLNLFVPDLAKRKRFADPNHDETKSKTLQLRKAHAAFQNLTETSWPT